MGTDERGNLLETQTHPGETLRPPSAPLPLLPGQILLDKYEVERILGVGGMGVVVSAMHLELGERVAIKAMLPEVAASRDHATRFAREAQAAARIKSEFVARVTDVGRLPDGTPFMVMEYLEGETLGAYLERHGALPVDVAVDTLLEACVALAEAHRLGIIHRDVKPANLFLARRPEGGDILKVLDFGISKSDENVTITRTSGAIGTPSYMSPEQLRSAGTVRPTADIWSLGVVLFEMLTRQLPYEASSFADICALVLVSPPRTPRSIDPSLPEALEKVILRCLERDQADRFGSVLELARALAPFATEAGCGLVDRIEQIGSARVSLVSSEEAPTSGRRSFASLPRITPRTLATTPRALGADLAGDEGGRPAPLGFSSAPPSSARPVVTPDLSRTPPVAWRTVPPSGDERGGDEPPRRGRAWLGAVAAASLAVLGGAWVLLRAPAGSEGGPPAATHPFSQAGSTVFTSAPKPATTATTATTAEVPTAAPSASASATPAVPPGRIPAGSPSVGRGPASTSAAPAAPLPPRSSTPPTPKAPPAGSSKFDDFGGRR